MRLYVVLCLAQMPACSSLPCACPPYRQPCSKDSSLSEDPLLSWIGSQLATRGGSTLLTGAAVQQAQQTQQAQQAQQPTQQPVQQQHTEQRAEQGSARSQRSGRSGGGTSHTGSGGSNGAAPGAGRVGSGGSGGFKPTSPIGGSGGASRTSTLNSASSLMVDIRWVLFGAWVGAADGIVCDEAGPWCAAGWFQLQRWRAAASCICRPTSLTILLPVGCLLPCLLQALGDFLQGALAAAVHVSVLEVRTWPCMGMPAWRQRGGAQRGEGGTWRPGGVGHPFVCTCAFQGRQNCAVRAAKQAPATCRRPAGLSPRPKRPFLTVPRTCRHAAAAGPAALAKFTRLSGTRRWW